jgi:hypothetical protein
MMSTKALSGAKMLLWSAAILLVGGPLLGLLFGSLGMAALAFGFGAAHLGLGQLWESEHRGGRLIGFTLVLAGAFTVVDAAIWMLSGAGL